MAQRSFKTDESFLEKLAIGAIGTRKVLENLTQQGHQPVELERGSTGYKIWKSIKIKRVRVPDILCVNSGTRVESRAKTKLVISMSHSSADETRGWNFGLKNDDYRTISGIKRTILGKMIRMMMHTIQAIRKKLTLLNMVLNSISGARALTT